MTTQLPPNLQSLFTARPTPRYLQPVDLPPEKRVTSNVDGVAASVDSLRDYKETDNANWMDFEHSDANILEQVHKRFSTNWTDSEHQKRVNKKLEKQEKQKKLLTEDAKDFDPSKDPKVIGDAIKTLFVSRLSYKVTERELEKEFGRFGALRKIRLVKEERPKTEDDADSKEFVSKKSKRPHRGYAFIEFEKERDSKTAYHNLNGQRIMDRPVVVDVERGRTVEGWLPRRLGGGKGGRHYTKITVRPNHFGGYPSGPPGPGGFRGGGFRGGFQPRGFSDGPRGGGGYRGRGGFDRGGFGGPRGGFSGAPPEGAPAGPRGRGGFGGPGLGRPFDRSGPPPGGYEDKYGYGGGGGGYQNGAYGGGGGARYEARGVSGSNAEPVAARNQRYDREIKMEDREIKMEDRSDDYSRKRHREPNEYDDHRSKRRY